MDEIIRFPNERGLQGKRTPEEQRVKFINVVNNIRPRPGYRDKYDANSDPFNRNPEFEKYNTTSC